MKRLLMISCLALGTALGASAASATPATTSVGGLSNTHSGIQLVKDKHNRHYKHNRYSRRHWRHHRRYRHHDRYRGWHRYHHRPRNWRGRGCVILGPVWVCP